MKVCAPIQPWPDTASQSDVDFSGFQRFIKKRWWCAADQCLTSRRLETDTPEQIARPNGYLSRNQGRSCNAHPRWGYLGVAPVEQGDAAIGEHVVLKKSRAIRNCQLPIAEDERREVRLRKCLSILHSWFKSVTRGRANRPRMWFDSQVLGTVPDTGTLGTRGGPVQTPQAPFTPPYLPFDADAWTRAWNPGKLW